MLGFSSDVWMSIIRCSTRMDLLLVLTHSEFSTPFFCSFELDPSLSSFLSGLSWLTLVLFRPWHYWRTMGRYFMLSFLFYKEKHKNEFCCINNLSLGKLSLTLILKILTVPRYKYISQSLQCSLLHISLLEVAIRLWFCCLQSINAL